MSTHICSGDFVLVELSYGVGVLHLRESVYCPKLRDLKLGLEIDHIKLGDAELRQREVIPELSHREARPLELGGIEHLLELGHRVIAWCEDVQHVDLIPQQRQHEHLRG